MGRLEEPIKYLCLVYYDEMSVGTLPEGERADFARETLAYRDDLRAGGRCLAAAGLASGEAATTVRVRGGRASITDGPLLEGRERLREFYVIDARDLNDVLRVVLRMPTTHLGAVEVWPVDAQL